MSEEIPIHVMGYRTNIEQGMREILTSLNIDFLEQHPTPSGFVLDFAIIIDRKENKKVAIECDGSKWHSSKKAKQRDRFRDYMLRKSGWTILRFGENEITLDNVKNRIGEVYVKWNVDIL